MTTLFTGANGFVGSALCARLRKEGVSVRGAVRTLKSQPSGAEAVAIGSLSSETDWKVALRDVEQVVHLAARVHVMNDKSSDPLSEFRRVNVEGTANFARQAAAAGVRRFIFLSSVKVNGEATQPGHLFAAHNAPAPQEPYGISKMEAEQGLREIAAQTGMEVVIIRPPLVYGAGVKANFKVMMRWLAHGVPLPLGGITGNRRSLVALDNLVDLIVTCISHPAAANQTFMVSDGEDLSTADLLRRIGHALGKPARLLPVPPSLLMHCAALFGKSEFAQRLCDSLQVDISKNRQLLGWNPPLSVDQGLKKAAEGYLVEAHI
jgi:nucleoside-diphosphate-sugar epimerase